MLCFVPTVVDVSYVNETNNKQGGHRSREEVSRGGHAEYSTMRLKVHIMKLCCLPSIRDDEEPV
jgi:hypothetical protein